MIGRSWWRILILLLILTLSVIWLCLLVGMAPEVENKDDPEHKPYHLKFPSSLEELKNVSKILNEYMNEASSYVFTLFASAYLFKQTFAIPGSVFLNVMAGAVFGLPMGFTICSVLTAVGASNCYMLSKLCGQGIAFHLFPDRLSSFKKKLEQNSERIPYFLLFLRLFPMTPNWAINMCCGVLGVSLRTFFVTVFVGLMPYNYISVQTGVILSTITNMSDIFTWSVMLQLTGIAAVALLPSFFVRRKNCNEFLP